MEKTKIHLLKNDVVGKISAGEVVERPASVVKELIENSIDAGADSILIEVQDAGQSLIRVADNGEGMSLEDTKLACLRHSTSKLTDISDLERISTLGFRGEALSSISAVSQMEITSYNGDDESAVYVYLEGGDIQKACPAARSRGTTIEVRNLFYNVPARRKFLNKESTELAIIIKTVGRFMLMNDDIEFQLKQGSRSLMHAPKGSGLLERMKLVLGPDVADNMLEISSSSGKYTISGYVSRPSKTRKDKESQVFFVNSRFVRSKLLSDSLQEAYRSLLEKGRYPSAVLFLSMAPQEVDVNVHPTKLMVKFDDEKDVRDVLTQAVKLRFEQFRQAPSVQEELQAEAPNETVTVQDTLLSDRQEVQPEFAYEVHGESHRTRGIKDKGLLPMTGEGEGLVQFSGCYILEIKDDMVTITDQHAAHERILYEYFSKMSGGKTQDVQNLLFPVRLDLSADESVVMESMLERFGILGFQIEPFGKGSFVVQAVPAVIKDSDVKSVVYDILSDLMAKDLAELDPLEELIKLTSCRAAIKAGDSMTRGEMDRLLEQLKRCDLPFTCPHGRPTSFDMTLDELEKRFRRK